MLIKVHEFFGYRGDYCSGGRWKERHGKDRINVKKKIGTGGRVKWDFFGIFKEDWAKHTDIFHSFGKIFVFLKDVFWYMVGLRLHLLILNTEEKTIQLNIESNNNFCLYNDYVLYVAAVYDLITYGRDLYYAFIDANRRRSRNRRKGTHHQFTLCRH